MCGPIEVRLGTALVRVSPIGETGSKRVWRFELLRYDVVLFSTDEYETPWSWSELRVTRDALGWAAYISDPDNVDAVIEDPEESAAMAAEGLVVDAATLAARLPACFSDNCASMADEETTDAQLAILLRRAKAGASCG